jgi:hypothetical protein
MSSNLNSAESDESFGFRDFYISVDKPATGGCPEPPKPPVTCPLY